MGGDRPPQLFGIGGYFCAQLSKTNKLLLAFFKVCKCLVQLLLLPQLPEIYCADGVVWVTGRPKLFGIGGYFRAQLSKTSKCILACFKVCKCLVQLLLLPQLPE